MVTPLLRRRAERRDALAFAHSCYGQRQLSAERCALSCRHAAMFLICATLEPPPCMPRFTPYHRGRRASPVCSIFRRHAATPPPFTFSARRRMPKDAVIYDTHAEACYFADAPRHAAAARRQRIFARMR